MKLEKLYRILFALFLLVFFAGCSSTKQAAKKKTILTGKVLSVEESFFKINYDTYDLLENTKRKNVDIEENGEFKIVLDVKGPVKGYLDFGRNLISGRGFNKWIYFYLEPGDSVYLTADTDFMTDTNMIARTLMFLGNRAPENRFINDQDLAFNSYPQLRQNNFIFIHDLSGDDYKRNVDSIKDEQLRYLKAYDDTVSLSKKLKEIYSYEAENLANARKINYPSGHKSFTKAAEINLPAGYYGFMDSVELAPKFDNAGWPYLRFVHFYLKNKFDLAKTNGYTGDYIHFLDTELTPRQKYVYMAYSLSTDFNAEVYNQFGAGTPYKDIQKIVKERYGYLESMLPGKPAPEVVLENLAKERFKSVDAYQGKYVYLDFWATWCKPCIAEIPDLNVLREEYKDKNIEFVSLSVDADRKEWEEYMAEHGLTGPQYWLDGKNKAIYDKGFNILMIPRFVLLDDEGKIIDANAPRPSSGADIRKLLDTSLK